jgi:LysM repeat protein
VPIAIAAVAIAAYLIVHANLHTKSSTATNSSLVTTTTSQTHAPRRKFYTVQQGDNLSAIAAKTGVSVGSIETLNPTVDPNALQPGQVLRLRR